jgi:hypothetical protein
MINNIRTIVLVAAATFGIGLVAVPSAQADPDCSAPAPDPSNVLWGDYFYMCQGGQQNKPAAAPSISWDQGLGTLTAHVTDRSGVSSQCTYTSGLVDRSFSLPANGTFDVVIAPAVPAFHNWDVNVSCDNGAVANTSKFF